MCVGTNHNKQLNNHRKTSESILTTSQLLSQCNNFTVQSILTCKTLPKEINDCNNHRKTKHKWQEHNTRWYSDSEFKVTGAWMGRYVTEDREPQNRARLWAGYHRLTQTATILQMGARMQTVAQSGINSRTKFSEI